MTLRWNRIRLVLRLMVLVVAFVGGAIQVLANDRASAVSVGHHSGEIKFIEAAVDNQDGIAGLWGASAVAVSPDGIHVYVTGRWDSCVSVFLRDPTTGRISLLDEVYDDVGGVDGLMHPGALELSPDGLFLYVTSGTNTTTEDAVTTFARDPASGLLTFVGAVFDNSGGIDGIDKPSAVVVSPDGQNVYVTGEEDDALASFSRDPSTGVLTFMGAHFHPAVGVISPRDVAVSPDGKHVYVTTGLNTSSRKLAIFVRNLSTGALTYFKTTGGDAYLRSSDVVVSPDGSTVYESHSFDNTLAVYSRDAGTGDITFVEEVVDGVGGVEGMYGASAMAISGDGSRVFVSGINDYAVTAFHRDQATGALTYRGSQFDSVLGVTDLRWPRRMAVTPDGLDLYVATADDAVVVFNTAVRSGLISWWPGDGSADSTAPDVAGANDGVLTGGATFADGSVCGKVFAFDGVNDWISVPNDASLNLGSGDFTISYWVRTTQVSGTVSVLDKRSSTASRGVHAYLFNGEPGLQMKDDSGTTNFRAPVSVADGRVHHLCIVVDRDSTLGGWIFVDGEVALGFDPTLRAGSLNNSEGLSIGRRSADFGGDAHFAGQLDEVEIFGRALEDYEVARVFAACNAVVFSDGFESGDTSAWSTGLP